VDALPPSFSYYGGCFVAIIVRLFSDGYLPTIDRLFGECFIADVASISSSAISLLSRLCWLHGGCFAIEVALVSFLADDLLSLLQEARVIFYGWMFCHRSYDFSIEIIVLMSIFLRFIPNGCGSLCMSMLLLL